MAEPVTRTQSILSIIQAWLPVLTVVIGAAWGLYTYIAHQKDVQQEAARQADKDAATRKLQAQKPFLEKQLALYFETAQVVGKMATRKPGDPVWEESENRFWQLYWSELSMVETRGIEGAMVATGTALKAYKSAPDDAAAQQSFNNTIYKLAHAIRDSIEATWQSDQAPR